MVDGAGVRDGVTNDVGAGVGFGVGTMVALVVGAGVCDDPETTPF